MISKTAIYALRSMVVLRRHMEEGPVAGHDIAIEGGVPPPYIGTIMNRLRVAKLIDGSRGPGGGYSLRVPAKRLNIEKIVRLFDDVDAQRGCVLGHSVCGSTSGCPVHEMWSDVLSAYDRFLTTMTLERLAAIQRISEAPKSPAPRAKKPRGRRRSGKKYKS